MGTGTKTIIVVQRGQFPSPSSYTLPSVLGYPRHDITKTRNPAYTISEKRMEFLKRSPDMQFVRPGQTRFGKDKVRAHTLGERRPEPPSTVPGPCTYAPERFASLKGKKAPAFSISNRIRDPMPPQVPAPNTYRIPSCIGPKLPHMRSSAAHSIYGKPYDHEASRSPGPAAYRTMDPDKYKRRLPTYTMSPRAREVMNLNPGPAAYRNFSNSIGANPKYTFGIKHSDYMGYYVSDEEQV
jgi:hypothetical protein